MPRGETEVLLLFWCLDCEKTGLYVDSFNKPKHKYDVCLAGQLWGIEMDPE